MVVLVAHEGEKAACYSLVYDEVEGCAEGYHTAPGETADKVPLMDGCSLEIIVYGFHEYRQYQQYSNGAGESRKAAEKAAEQVFLFSAHVHAQEACQQEKALGHGGKQEYAAGEQAKQGGREKGGPPVRIQREKLIGRNGGAYSAEGGDEHRSTKGATPGEKGEYSY